MKKKLAVMLSVICLVVLGLASCGTQGPLEPPALTIACGEQEFTAWRGSYSWGQGGENVIADSPHPLDVLEDLPVLEAQAGDQIQLTFPTEPWQLSVVTYADTFAGTSSEAGQIEVPLEGNVLTLSQDGTGMVYEVRADWEQGAAIYAFYVPGASGEKVLLPGDLPMEFVFSSGAGGWSTAITLERNGSFLGMHQESDLGSTGEGYPNGTVYTCEFSGQFWELEQMDDHTYFMTLDEVELPRDPGEAWIEDGVLHMIAEPYGLDQGERFLLYTPETPVAGLDEEFLRWWPGGATVGGEIPETLGCYGLYNKEMGYGFFTAN